MDPASYSRPWLVISMACAPLAVVCYCNAYDQPQALGGAAAVGTLLATLALVITRGRSLYEVPTLTFGTR